MSVVVDGAVCKCGHLAIDHGDVDGQSHYSKSGHTGTCGCVRSAAEAALPENSLAYYDASVIGNKLDGLYLIGRNSRRLKEQPIRDIVGDILHDYSVTANMEAFDIAIAMYGHPETVDRLLRVLSGCRNVSVVELIRFCDAISTDERPVSSSDVFLRIHAAIRMAESDWFVATVAAMA